MTLIQQCLAVSSRIKDGRKPLEVFAKAGEELGELAQEILIATGNHYKDPGEDGVIGEALDLIVCAVDIIYGQDKHITEYELQAIITKKLAKWVEKSELQYPGSTK